MHSDTHAARMPRFISLPMQVNDQRDIGQHQHIDAQVKLSASQQQWLIQIARHNICLRFLFLIQLLPPATDLHDTNQG